MSEDLNIETAADAAAGSEGASATQRGVTVEYDFTAVPGGEKLFDETAKLLSGAGVELSCRIEAKYLLNRSVQTGLSLLLQREGGSGSSAEMAQTLLDEFKKDVSKTAAAGITAGFKAFVKTLAARNVRVAIVTRADPEAFAPFLAEFPEGQVIVVADDSVSYGCLRRDGWTRACTKAGLRAPLSVAVTGSGFGVRGALQAGLSAVCMPSPRTAWQDFGGSDAEIDGFSAESANEILRVMHLA